MYEKLAVSIIVIVLIILILLFLALDTKRTVGQQVVTGIRQLSVSNPASKVSIETITVAKPPTSTRLTSKAMNLQLKVLGSEAGILGPFDFVGGVLDIPALNNSKGRIINITNVSASPTLVVRSVGAGVIFPSTRIPPSETITFNAIRDNEYIKV